MSIFQKIWLSFIHLKLEIASAIPASNEWKLLTNNSAEQELMQQPSKHKTFV